ncbi:hypothetical protein [Desulfocurvibacter africanus]|uniref:hypothetical protein n=1 Tax=Desulfocurvibacter africanus TaxID=873 RepID=UPI000400484A|nr:hypothetical protein [Desulfocurvibacter africanus]
MKQGSGKRRKPYRIKEWMADIGLEVNDVAAELGVHHSLVSHTIFGRKNSRRVLRALRDKGCPKQFLALPEDLENNGQEAA